MSTQGHNRMVMPGATPLVNQYGTEPPLPDVLAERLRGGNENGQPLGAVTITTLP